MYEEVIETFSDKCKVISINSGKGCGDAVLVALQQLSNENLSSPIIMWGDLYVEDSKIFKRKNLLFSLY